MIKIIWCCLIFRVISYLGISSFLLGIAPSYAEAPKITKIIKFTTVAPDQSTWTNVVRDIAKELIEKSGGKLELKIYAGGALGDEKEFIKKMQIGELDCAGFTGVGLGKILPEVRIFDLPFFFKDYEEIDFIRNQFKDRFARAFEKKGYILLGWTEVGFIYFFSKLRIDSLDKLRSTKTKIWLWEGDPLARALFDAIKINPIPLSIKDVMTSFDKGHINTVYASPLGAIVLQWFIKMKYILELPMANATGAILITKKSYDTLSSDLQEILTDVFKKHMVRLIQMCRNDDAAAIEVMKAYGIELISLNDKSLLKQLEDAGVNTRKALTGNLYSAELLKEFIGKIEEYRKDNTIMTETKKDYSTRK